MYKSGGGNGGGVLAAGEAVRRLREEGYAKLVVGNVLDDDVVEEYGPGQAGIYIYIFFFLLNYILNCCLTSSMALSRQLHR